MALVVALGSATVALAVATQAEKCQQGKNVESGRYAACRLKAEAKFALTGDAPARTAALQRCTDRYNLTWPVIEAKARGACPSTGDQAAIQGCLDATTMGVAEALAGGALACGQAGPPGQVLPTEPRLLTPPGAGTHDEDPSLLRARDGRFHLAWASDRDGNDDLYVVRSSDGRDWGAPVRVTTSPDPDWCPSLAQTPDGRFHLVWFRVDPRSPPHRRVMTNSSPDGLAWDARNEVMITDGSADDWAPTVVATSGGDLLVTYSREGDLYLSRSADGARGAVWQAPVRLDSASDPAEVDLFARVVERAPGDLAMVWVRYAASGAANYWDVTTDLYSATSSDGLTWTDVLPITHDDAAGFVDSVPTLYRDGDGGWHVIWTSTGPNAPAAPKILDLPLAARAGYPSGVTDATAAHGMIGWSVAAAAMDTSGMSLGVWVNGHAGSKRLWWQLFSQ